MKIISSQRYLDEKIVNEKITMLGDELTLEVWAVGDFDDRTDLAILFDGNHRLAAAQAMEIPVRFEIVEQPENLTGERLLESCWMDSDYFYVETGRNVW